MSRSNEAQLVMKLIADQRGFQKDIQKSIATMNEGTAKMDRVWSRGTKSMSRSAKKFGRDAERSFKRTTSRINGLLATVGLSVGVAQVIKYGDAWIEAGNKVRSAEASIGKPLNTLEELKDAAQETRLSLSPTVDLYTRLARAGEPLNKSQDDILRTTVLLNKAFKAGGSAASEQESAILQLTQAIQSGALQGDEYRTIREAAPLLLDAIAKELRVGKDALKELAREGAITSNVIFAAIEGSASDIESQFDATKSTIGESFTYLKNEVISFIGNVDDGTGASERLTSAIINFADTLPERIDGTLDALSDIGSGIEFVIAKIEDAGEKWNASIFGKGLAVSQPTSRQGLQKQIDELGGLIALAKNIDATTGFGDVAVAHQTAKLPGILGESGRKILTQNYAADQIGTNIFGSEAYDAVKGDFDALLDIANAKRVQLHLAFTAAKKEVNIGPESGGLGRGGDMPKSLTTITKKATAEEKAAATRLARELAVIEKLGQTEREQVTELLNMRLASIEKSALAETEKADLRGKAHTDAARELGELDKAREDAAAKVAQEQADLAASNFQAHQDKLGFAAEISAATARMSGRALEATQIEMAASRARYQAELDDIERVIAARGGTSPELEAQKLNAQAGIATVDTDEASLKKNALNSIKGISDGDENNFESQLERLAEEQEAKIQLLEGFRSTDTELKRAYEEEKLQIDAEYSDKRKQLLLADVNAQLDAASTLAGAIGKIGKEGSKAQKAAAKVQQGIALGRAVVNGYVAVSEAVASAPFPANIPAIALATAVSGAQVAGIMSQSFDGGGPTGSGSRSGGVDGKGGRYAIVHPNEIVADMTKPGREVAGRSVQDVFGLTPEIASTNISIPNVSIPSLVGVSGARRQETYNIGAPTINIAGNADSAAIDALRGELAADRAMRGQEFSARMAMHQKSTVPRSRRTSVGGR